MKTLNFQTEIKATTEKVWDCLFSDKGFRYWSSAFTEGSHAVSSWEKGGRIQFLSPAGDGIFSLIEEKEPFKKMHFKHLGEIINGKEEVRDWAGAKECYNLSVMNGKTVVNVSLDTTEDTYDYFESEFPKALAKLKEYSEKFD